MWKELYIFFLYFLITFLFTLILSLNYVSYFISGLCTFLEEGLILHDSTVWVWALWRTGFFICIWLILPYFCWLFFIWIKNWNTQFDVLIINLCLCLIIYSSILSIYFFVFDLFNSTFALPNIKNISFEFQPEIENYLNFFFGFFFDLFKSLFFFQLILIFGITLKLFYLDIKKYFIFLQFFTLILFYYWFAGDGGLSDFCLCFSILLLNQVLIYCFLVFKSFRKYKKMFVFHPGD